MSFVLSLFADEMIVYISDPKNSTRELINTFRNEARYKTNSKKSVPLLYTKDKQTEKEIIETSPFTIATNKHKISQSNSNQTSLTRTLNLCRRQQKMERSPKFLDR